MKLTGKTYDILKALAQLWLPAVGTLYFALAGLWGLPAAEQVVGTIVAIDAFLGVILGISSANFNSENVGAIVTQELPSGGKTYTLELEGDPEDIEKVDEARFKVMKGEKVAEAVALPPRRRTTGRRPKKKPS
jgi:hypothetical protein